MRYTTRIMYHHNCQYMQPTIKLFSFSTTTLPNHNGTEMGKLFKYLWEIVFLLHIHSSIIAKIRNSRKTCSVFLVNSSIICWVLNIRNFPTGKNFYFKLQTFQLDNALFVCPPLGFNYTCDALPDVRQKNIK